MKVYRPVISLFVLMHCSSALATELTIDDAVNVALDQNSSLKVSDAAIEGKHYEITAAQQSELPSLKADVGLMYGGGSPTSFFAVNNKATLDEPLGTTHGLYGTASLVFDMPIYKNGVLLNRNSPKVQQAISGFSKENASKDQQIVDIANQVATSYLDALSAAEEFEYRDGVSKKLLRLKDYVRERQQTRHATYADELTVDAALIDAESESKAAKRRYELHLKQLAAIMGMDYKDRIDPKRLTATPPALPEPETLVDAALTSQPLIAQQEATIQSAQAELKNARHANDSALSFVAMGTAASGFHQGAGLPMFGAAGVKLSVPLWGEKKQDTEVAVKAQGVIVQELQLKSVKDAIAKQIYASYYAVNDAMDKLQTSKKKLELANQQSKLNTSKFEKGMTSVDNIVQDEIGVMNAAIERVKAHYNAWKEYAELLKATGRQFSTSNSLL